MAPSFNCTTCGGPLEIEPSTTYIRCGYCGNQNNIRAVRPLATGEEPTKRSVPRWMLATFAVVAILGIVSLAGAGRAIYRAVRSIPPVPGSSPAEGWDGKSTLSCSNQKLVLEDKTIALPGETLIKGGVNCTLTIKHCTFAAARVIEAGINNRIDIVDSQLAGSEAAITGSQNMEVHITGKSTLSGGDRAVSLGQNSHLQLRGTHLDSQQVAIELGQNSRLEARDAVIHSDATALDIGQSSQIVLRNTEVTGKRHLSRGVSVDERP